MSRKFIATILAVTLAVTAFASKPAQAASEEDIAKIIAGAATIFIIGKAIQGSRDNDHDDKKSKRYVYKDRDGGDRYKDKNDHRNRGRVIIQNHGRNDRGRDGHWSYSNRATPLPQACQVTARTRSGYETLFGARCLDRNYRSARRLPSECLRDVRSFRGERQAYSGSCLRSRGYSTARR